MAESKTIRDSVDNNDQSISLYEEEAAESDDNTTQAKHQKKWIKLNVGGKCFLTSYTTLVHKEPNSMLSRMFGQSQMNPSDMDEHGAYILDRSAEYFEPILNYLRHGQLIYNNNLNPAGILEEARFFGIEALIPQLEAIVQQSVQRTEVPLPRRDVVMALIRTSNIQELRFQGVDLTGANLKRLDLRKINFKYAILHKANLSYANLSNCCLERADLSYANLEFAQLVSVRGLCANMEGCNMKGCNFEDPIANKSNLENVNLKNACLEGANMSGLNLRLANLKYANMKNCNLRSAILAGADLESCNLSGSDLHEANLRGANLNNADLELMMTPIHMSQTIR